ncbi:FtsK/SpoIIIE domain-containing protein [Streptomyces sp. NPDC051555]|uniref:FtsK/SpoIIIE domain-containing protein n=1 Tax=Streptomyces sp. NPDC051555 TaxID=3365657 RepID=UPI0037989449
MAKKSQNDQDSEDMWGNGVGAIGVVVVVLSGLMTIKIKLGLPWIAAVMLTVGVLVLLGWGAWWLKTRVIRWWSSKPAAGKEPAPTAALGQETTAEPADVEPAHPELTRVFVRAGVIGKDEIIRLTDVTTERLPVGTRYHFLLPEKRTHEEVTSKLGPVASMFGVTRLHLKVKTSRNNEREITLIKLDRPPFTDRFEPPTRKEILAFDGIPLGHEVTGELGGVATLDRASMLIAGMSQMGKTTLLRGLIACLLVIYRDEFDLVLLDGKRTGLAPFAKLALKYEASSDPAVMEKLLDWLIAEMERRYAEQEQAILDRRPPPVFRRIIFFGDEVADFYKSNGTPKSKELIARVEAKSRFLVAKSLECGISVIFLTQRTDKDAIPVDVRAQFQYRLSLYVDSEGTAKVILGDSYFSTVAPISPALLNPEIKGQGVLFVQGASTLIRGFEFPDQFLWELVDETNARRKKQIAIVPDSPLKKAVEILKGKGVTFMETKDLAPLMGIPVTTPSAMGTGLSQLLGLTSGKDGIKRGYHLEDLAAALVVES